MGLTISRVFDRLLGKKHLRILMLGLDAAGKTTILYKLKINDVVSTVPTIGFNVETVEYKNIKFIVWDIGGGGIHKYAFWKHYFVNTNGIIFVVDSSDKWRIESVKQELGLILSDKQLKDVPFLFLANKQDIDGMSVTEVAENLDLPMIKDREWHIQGTSGLKGVGLFEGLDWLSKTLNKKK